MVLYDYLLYNMASLVLFHIQLSTWKEKLCDYLSQNLASLDPLLTKRFYKVLEHILQCLLSQQPEYGASPSRAEPKPPARVMRR